MTTVADILKGYTLTASNGVVTRIAKVPDAAKAQVGDIGQSILAWDKPEFVGKTLPDDVLDQVKTVRALIPDPGEGWHLGRPTDRSDFVRSCDTSKNIEFGGANDKNLWVPDLQRECDELRAKWEAEEDPQNKTAARVLYMQTMTFKRLLGREGFPSAINTYDPQVFTWGAGFGALSHLQGVFSAIFAIEKQSDDLETHHVQKLMYLCGFKFVPSPKPNTHGDYWVVDLTKKKLLVDADLPKKPSQDVDSAFRTIHDCLELHKMWVLLARDPLTRKTVVDAQKTHLFATSALLRGHDQIQTAALYTFLTHLKHWGPSFAENIVPDAISGKKLNRKIKAPMPSEEADSELAAAAPYLFYWYIPPKNGIGSDGPGPTNTAFIQMHDYWAQMVGADKAEEKLAIFNPVCPIMTADPVATEPPGDHLVGTVVIGKPPVTKFWDLGPKSDFGFPSDGEDVPATPAPDPAPDSEGSHWVEVRPATAHASAEQPSWWHGIL